MAEVFIAEIGQLTNPSKSALRKAGVTVVEVANITKCQFVRASEIVSADDMLYAALHALHTEGGYKGGTAFLADVLRIVTKQREEKVVSAARRPS